jgi:protein required for attachment to host cells
MKERPSTGTTWLIVADGEHARAVTPAAPQGQFRTVLSFDSVTAHLASHDLGTERLGRVHESASTTRHSIVPRQDLHTAAKHDFMLEVASQIALHVDEFDRLVLVAPDHALHDLRAALGETPRAKIVGTLAKDLTKVPDHGLMPHLSEWWHMPVDAA